MTKPKRTILSIDEQRNVIEHHRKHPSLGSRKLALLFGCGKGQIQSILTPKRIKEVQETGVNLIAGNRKRAKLSLKHEDVDKLVFEWFVKARSQEIPISGPIIQEKAAWFANEIGDTDFKASNGWLESFRKRHSIRFALLSGESKDVNQQTVQEWYKTLNNICKEYQPKDIFNADETGLFWKLCPDRSLLMEGEANHGSKRSKQRITLLLCCNSNGSEKKKLLMIAKSTNPRCFKNIKKECLPITYKANKKAWMTSSIFEEWLFEWDAKLKRQNRNILLFIDNATSHPDIHLENIRIEFLPKNTTSVLQALDQGIIRSLKVHYRKLLVAKLLALIESGSSATELTKNVNILDTCNWANEAWKKVTETTIRNCFHKAGFKQDEGGVVDEEEDILYQFDSAFDDEDLDLCQPLSKEWEADMVLNHIKALSEDLSDDEEAYFSAEEEIIEPMASIGEALKSLRILNSYAAQSGSIDLLGLVKNCEFKLLEDFQSSKEAGKQTCITDFFRPK